MWIVCLTCHEVLTFKSKKEAEHCMNNTDGAFYMYFRE